MEFRVTARRAQPDTADAPLLVLALPSGATLTPALTAVDAAFGGALKRSLDRKDFRGARDETLFLAGGAKGPQRVLLVGLGKPSSIVAGLRRAASVGSRQARKIGATSLTWFADEQSEAAIEAVAVGLTMGSWEYTTTRSAPPEDERKAALESAQILVSDEAPATAAVQRGVAIGQGINLARQLGMLPGNICTPDYLADTARDIAKRHGMGVTVLGRAEMKAEKMGSFLAVAQGTPQDPKLIVLEHKKGAAGSKPVVLVGKGLCFDSGGISIKPAQGMEAMKFDMCGAAGVLGAMDAIGAMNLPINVVGLVGSTTNMPSGEAMNPGDVVQSHLGKFIEIVNTDAEGRLVLADVLSYARRFDPAAVIDAATLTGACVVALGHTASGVFGNDQALIDEVLAAGQSSGDTGWQLPLFDDYKELILTDVADLKNTGGRAAGAISAAMFLKEFAETFPWVHLDIAGTAYSETDLGFIPKGPTGVPVSLFVDFVRGEGTLTSVAALRRGCVTALLGMAFARGARAQQVQRDTTPYPDSVRANKPPASTNATGDTMRVHPDSLHPRADSLKASTDTTGDSVSVLGLHPGDSATKIPKDTMKAPIAHAEMPPVLGVGEQYTWTRDQMFATGALTLTQLLELVPGVTTFTTGNLASPQFAAYAGNPGRVRVFLDGMELDNLDPRAGGALDLAELQLWSLEQVTIERGADELRIYCRTWSVQRTTTSTRIDVLTGDQRTNLYRAFFGKRYEHGELLQVGGQSYGTSSDPGVGGGNELALFARLGWANKDWSFDGYYMHADRTRDAREQDIGNVLLEPEIPEQDRARIDMYLRAGRGDPDSGVWAQAMIAHSNFREHSDFSAIPDIPLDSADTTRTSTQYIVTGGLTRWGLRLSGVERYHKLQTGGVSATEVRASFERRLLALSLYAERRGADSSSTEEATARLTPLPFFAVSGTVARRHGGTALGDEDEVSARLEAGLKFHQAWFSAGIWRRAQAVVPGLIAFDTIYTSKASMAATGPFASIRGKVWRDIGLNVWAVRWDSPGYYRPQLQSHEEIYIDTQWLQRFPSKHFRLIAGIAHEYRQDVIFPIANASESLSDPNGIAAIFSHAIVGRIEFHILDAAIYFNSYSGVSPTRVEQVNGYLLPTQRLEYGIRWSFWN